MTKSTLILEPISEIFHFPIPYPEYPIRTNTHLDIVSLFPTFPKAHSSVP